MIRITITIISIIIKKHTILFLMILLISQNLITQTLIHIKALSASSRMSLSQNVHYIILL